MSWLLKTQDGRQAIAVALVVGLIVGAIFFLGQSQEVEKIGELEAKVHDLRDTLAVHRQSAAPAIAATRRTAVQLERIGAGLDSLLEGKRRK